MYVNRLLFERCNIIVMFSGEQPKLVTSKILKYIELFFSVTVLIQEYWL